MDRKELGQILRMERSRIDVPMRHVSAESGIPLSVISELENGKRNARWDTVRRLLDFYGVNLVPLRSSIPTTEKDR